MLKIPAWVEGQSPLRDALCRICCTPLVTQACLCLVDQSEAGFSGLVADYTPTSFKTHPVRCLSSGFWWSWTISYLTHEVTWHTARFWCVLHDWRAPCGAIKAIHAAVRFSAGSCYSGVNIYPSPLQWVSLHAANQKINSERKNFFLIFALFLCPLNVFPALSTFSQSYDLLSWPVSQSKSKYFLS